jgi:HK97 family phage portal protein
MLLERLFEPRTLENPKWSLNDPDAWRRHFDDGRIAETDESVNVSKAITLSAVWQAIKMISGDCSKLPLKVYRYRADGEGKDVDRRHQVWALVNRDGRANDELSSLQLWRRFYAGALLYENAYIWIDRDDLGKIRGLYNLLPDRTAPLRVKGRLWYVSEVAGQLRPFPADDILHLCGLCWAGDSAPALVEAARHDFGLAIAARKFESKFFANGAQHGGVLQIPPGASKEARDKIESAVDEKRKNLDKAFKTLVLRDGYKWFSTTVDPDKANVIDLDDAKVRDVARWFMLAPSRLGVKESISYNSEEAAKQDYYDTTLSYWLTAVVAECNSKLLTERQRAKGTHVIRYQINALLWADASTRSEIAARGIETGRFSPDETRDWEGLNPRPDGQGGAFLRPLNMEAVPAAGEDLDPDADTETDPPGSAAGRGADIPVCQDATRQTGMSAPREEADRNVCPTAHRRLLESTLARACRRIAEHVRRAWTAGRSSPAIAATLQRDREALGEMLGDVLAAVEEVGWVSDPTPTRLQRVGSESQPTGTSKPAGDGLPSVDPGTDKAAGVGVADRLLAAVHAAVLVGVPADQTDSSDLRDAPTRANALAAWVHSFPGQLAAEILAGG